MTQAQAAVTFEKKYRIDMLRLAAEFARLSPDMKMKEAMKGLTP